MDNNSIHYCKNCGEKFYNDKSDFCSKHCACGYNPIITKMCPYCKQEFTIKKKKFAAHVKYCTQNPKRIEIDKNLKKTGAETIDKKYGLFKEFIVKCHVCGTKFTVIEREKLFPQKERYYCSDECGKKYANSCMNHDTFQKISNTLRSRYNKKPRICPVCKKEFTGNRKCCSDKCRKFYIHESYDRSHLIKRSQLELYRSKCDFHFSLRDYPDEFNFDLIKQYGWYKAKNHGDNLNGVSRDHMYSIKEGFVNNVDPKIMSHPANCKLLRHSDNVRKNSKSSITLQQLLERIDTWDKKYNK